MNRLFRGALGEWLGDSIRIGRDYVDHPRSIPHWIQAVHSSTLFTAGIGAVTELQRYHPREKVGK